MESSNSEVLKPVPFRVSLPLHHTDPFLYIERQSRQLQQDLQTFLDAQSAGLSAGLPASSGADSVSTGSSTPTPSQLSNRKSSVTVPVRQPRQRKVGLRGARRGILRSMHKLLTLKEEERQILGSELSDRREALREVNSYARKRDGLQESIKEIQQDDPAARMEYLTKESNTLKEEMHALETKLMEMRAQHHHVLEEMSQIQNSVDSRLSSYKESLSLLDADVKRYLKSPPLKPLPVDDNSTSNFYSLHPQRRTLEMAKEHWTGEQVGLRKRKRKVDVEIEALKEGGSVWNKAVSAVLDFEKSLAEGMQQSITLPTSPSSAGAQTSLDHAQAKVILGQLEDTTAQLEDLLKVAEQKSWNLLICSIGAELEAFRQAKPTLLAMLHAGEGTGSPESDNSDAHDNDVPPEFLTGSTDEDPISPGLDAKRLSEPRVSAEPKPNSEGLRSRPPLDTRPSQEDDEPDPAWLLP